MILHYPSFAKTPSDQWAEPGFFGEKHFKKSILLIFNKSFLNFQQIFKNYKTFKYFQLIFKRFFKKSMKIYNYSQYFHTCNRNFAIFTKFSRIFSHYLYGAQEAEPLEAGYFIKNTPRQWKPRIF